MTPEAAVAHLAEAIVARGDFTEDDLYTAMTEAGIPIPVADRAYKFTQIAWARVFLDGLGIKFAPDYLCFDAAGEIIESGSLAEEPYFTAATALAHRQPHRSLAQFTMMSSDFAAINNMLNAGSKPENLAMGPSALFMELPTPAGREKVRRVLSERVAPLSKKPWWRFW